MFRYRHATFAEVESIFALINGFAAEGLMLPKTYSTLYETLPEFVVKIVGCGALHCTWAELAEIRSLAVHRDFHRRGIGGEIVKILLDDGKKLGVTKFFTLTYNAKFFGSVGFEVVPRESLPQKIWRDCLDCPKFPACDEIAMTRE